MHVYQGNNIERNLLRGYVPGPLDSYDNRNDTIGGILTIQLDLKSNLNNPAEIQWEKDFDIPISKFREEIANGKPHIHFGDFDSPESYIGSPNLKEQSMGKLLGCRGRIINGWGEILCLIDEALFLEKNTVTIRPGEEAETLIREFLEPFKDYS